MYYYFQGDYVTEESDSYESDRLLYNRAYSYKPKGIMYCKTIYDVCTAVDFVREYNQKFSICCGGHHYTGFCSNNEGYVINVSRLNQCVVDKNKCIVTIGCGALSMGLCTECENNGYLFPAKDCIRGISSWTLSGGIGNCCRRFGLSCDNLLEIEMVDFRGDIIIASDYCNQDLFWAIKGAGLSNFGIVTSLTFRLSETMTSVTYFEINVVHISRTMMIDFLDVWQHSILSFDWSINCHAELNNTFHMGLCLKSYGISFLSIEETRSALTCFSDIHGISITIEQRTYSSYLSQISKYNSPYESFNATGRFVYQEYSTTEIERLTDIVYGRRPEGSIFTSLQLDGLGGSVAQYDRSATAFYYRDASYLMTLKTQWFDASCKSENDDWFGRKFNYIHDITYGSFIQEPYAGLKNYETEYYGENIHRLREIKARYDPYNVFSFSQGIKI